MLLLLYSGACSGDHAQNSASPDLQTNLKNENMKINIIESENGTAKNTVWNVRLSDNSSAKALVKKLREGPVTLQMHDYGRFEKVGELPFTLPRNDKQINVGPGDVILYQGNQITFYYDENSWNFTHLGKILNVTQDEMKVLLGSGNITAELSVE